jgi:hypothetical protein
MVAMEAIENWDVLKGDMNFDDLFGALYEKESYFFDKTKVIIRLKSLLHKYVSIDLNKFNFGSKNNQNF